MKLPTPFDRMKTLTTSILLFGFVLSAVVILAYLIHPSFINTINNKTTDVVMALSPSKLATSSVEIVDLDEKSLATYGQWPWPPVSVGKSASKSQRFRCHKYLVGHPSARTGQDITK